MALFAVLSVFAQRLLELDDESVADVMGGPLDVLLMFETRWCEACSMLKPHLARLHQLVNAGDKMPLPLFVATIDAERWTKLASVHGVTEYPSLLYFAAGRRSDPATFPGTDMASLLSFVGVQAQLGSAGADGHGFGAEGRAKPSAYAAAQKVSPGGGAAMGAITCGGQPPGLLVGGELGGLTPSLKPAAQGGPRSRDEVSAAAVARWDPGRKARIVALFACLGVGENPNPHPHPHPSPGGTPTGRRGRRSARSAGACTGCS